jgi:hypothetical protein
MNRIQKGLTLCLFLASGALPAADWPGALGYGAQGALVFPNGEDLRITTGSGLSLDLGIHATWTLDTSSELRPRLDLLTFAQGRQDVTTPLVQHLETKVQGLSLGCEYLYRFQGSAGRWGAGAGLYLIRWSVDSTNRVTVAGAGVAQNTGTSHWTREGLGLVGTYRITPHLEGEARWISSHYAYENLPARFGTLGLLWRF